MACSTKAQKIALQVISTFYLVVAVIMIVWGIIVLTYVNKVTEPDTTTTAATILCWFLISIGTLMTVFSIFGIYNVAKENAGKVKAYGIIHVVMMILNIIGVCLNFSVPALFSVLLSGVAAFLSFRLAQRFKNQHPDTLNSVGI